MDIMSSNLNLSNISSISSLQGTMNSNSPWAINLPSVTVSLDDLMDKSNYHPSIKQYEVFESPEDVLALSVVWKRLRDNGQSPTGKLLDKILFDRVTQSDRDEANIIRDYYSKKFMMKALLGNGNALSPFRQEISRIINSDGKIINKNAFGPVYYLPMFYEYDCQLDFVKSCVTVVQESNDNPIPMVVKRDKELIPIKRIEKKSKTSNVIEYWLKHEEKNSANVIVIQKDNPLLNVWDHIFTSTKVLQISGGYEFKKLDNFEYFKINKWDLAQA